MTHRDTSSNPLHPQATPLQRFGATLRQYRQQRGLYQQDLAARTGIRQRYLSQIEQGRRNIAVLALLRLARALDIPAAWLLAPIDPHGSPAAPVPAETPAVRARGEAGGTEASAGAPVPDDPALPLRLLGATVRQYRQQQQLSQRALAARTGLSATYITEIEQGHRNLSVLSLVRLAEVLGLSVSHLLAPSETSYASSPRGPRNL